MTESRPIRTLLTAPLALSLAMSPLFAQEAPRPTQEGQSAPMADAGAPQDQANATDAGPHAEKPVKSHDRRHAAKLYLQASRLYEDGRFESALADFAQAAAMDPTNTNYSMASQVARSHAVTALIQTAAKARIHGDAAASRAALERARALDPKNDQVRQHLYELADADLPDKSGRLYEDENAQMAGAPRLEPTPGVQTFHLKTDRRQLLDRVFKAYGIQVSIDQSVPAMQGKFDLDSATFSEAMNALSMTTNTFYVPLDAHRVIVARDSRENRDQFLRQEMETIYLPGFSAADMTEVTNIAKNIFATQQVAVQQNAGTVTVRAPAKTLDAFNATMQNLVNGRSQVMLDVHIIQLAHSNERNIGVQLPQQVTAFNVYAEEQAILNQNAALVQQIIASGLAAPGDTLAILGILLASGQISNSIFSNGIALFGGGLTLSGLSPGPTTLHLNLNSSDSRELDSVQLRLSDGQEETLRSGTRYPILQASYSGLAAGGVNIPGLTTAGSSSGLTSLLSSINGATTQIPQVQYQDLGLTLKATPKVMRSGDVALTLDLKITSLAGGSLNGIPVLNNRDYSGVITLKEGSASVLASELDKQESLALSGTPGLAQIPGMNNVNEKDVQSNYAMLLVVLTPHLIAGPKNSGHGPMLQIERSSVTR